MKKNIVRKGLVSGIIILFVGMSFNSISGIQIENKPIIQSYRGNTLYVGGSGGDNYTSIQSAIDDAIDNDTVFVYDDSSPYYENVLVNKTLNLFGEDKNTTIIDGKGKKSVVTVTVDFVNISGFTIQNSNGLGGGIDTYSNHNNYYNNIIMKTDAGIRLNYNINHYKESSNNKIYKNIIKDNVYGICGGAENAEDLIKCMSNKIYNNDIYNNDECGISIGGCFNTISRNQISYNGYSGYSYEWAGGICIGCCMNNKIIYNNLSNNKCGVTIIMGLNNVITKNNFFKNSYNAYFLNFILKLPNTWIKNYWDDWVGIGPKIIYGHRLTTNYYFLPLRNFDWSPSRYPCDVTNFQGCGI